MENYYESLKGWPFSEILKTTMSEFLSGAKCNERTDGPRRVTLLGTTMLLLIPD